MGCSTLVIGRNHEKEKMKQEIERKEEEIKNLGEKVREDEKEKERNSFCRSHWKVQCLFSVFTAALLLFLAKMRALNVTGWE